MRRGTPIPSAGLRSHAPVWRTGGAGPTVSLEMIGAISADSASYSTSVYASARTGKTECQSCKERRYVDGSNDPGVSFKSPQYVAPTASAAAVSSHEREHVNREQAKAKDEGKKVLSQTVQIKTAVCPECGRTYVAGGTTTAVTASKSSSSSSPASSSSSSHAHRLDTYA